MNLLRPTPQLIASVLLEPDPDRTKLSVKPILVFFNDRSVIRRSQTGFLRNQRCLELYLLVNFHFEQLVVSEGFCTDDDAVVKFLGRMVSLRCLVVVTQGDEGPSSGMKSCHV